MQIDLCLPLLSRDLSKGTDSRLRVPVQAVELSATLQKSEEILAEIQKSELLSAVFDSLKT